MKYGYTGRLLRVNLSLNRISMEEPDEVFYRQYLGGRGFIVYHMLKQLSPGIDPLSRENKLIFACGPATGLPIAGAGRYAVGAKSPMTGGFGEAESGGYFGVELKKAGYDLIVVEGQASSPVYLWIADGKAEIRDASHLWGLDVADSEDAIRAELRDDKIRIAEIGVAGENLVRYATIMNDCVHSASRTGMGAVMGSKKLKAIAVKGSLRIKAANADAISAWAKKAKEDKRETESLTLFGTASVMGHHGRTGNLPVRNFRDGFFEGLDKIDGKALVEGFRIATDGCYGCFVRCDPITSGETKWGGIDPRYGGPEYETIGALGSCCGVDDLSAIVKGNELCNRYGLDTISCGVTIAFAMECYERGLITERETDGIQLRFGNAEAMVAMINKIAFREGFGDILAEGSQRAAERIGKDAGNCAMQVKGLEIPMHDPRYKKGLGLGMMVNPAGPDHACWVHDTAFSSEEGIANYKGMGIYETMPPTELSARKVAAIYKAGLQFNLSNNLVMCIFVPYGLAGYREIVNAATGWDLTDYELLKAAERSLTLAHIFNLREGFTANDDSFPLRMHESQKGGPLEGEVVDRKALQEARGLLYGMLGWDPKTGVPARARLVELGIEWADPIGR